MATNNFLNEYSYDPLDAQKQMDYICVTHNLCKMKYNTLAKCLIDGMGCPYCQGRKLNKEYAQYKIDCLVGAEEFTVLNDNIVNAHSELKILHNKCGRVTDTLFQYFYYQAPYCHHCNKEATLERIRKPHSQFVEEVSNKYNGAFTVLTEYVNANTDVTIRHEYCGNELTFLGGRISSGLFGCKYYNLNLPESTIYSRLQNYGIKCDIQYTFLDCIGIHKIKLPFDFSVFDENNNLLFLIEFDGRCHDEPIYSDEAFERTLRNDAIKNEYCNKNNIPLHRIHYSNQKNLNEIIDNILSSYNLIV